MAEMKILHPIVIACKESPERLPPVLALVEVMSELSDNVVLVTNKTDSAIRMHLENRGVKVVEAWPEQKTTLGPRTLTGKAWSWMVFRRVFWDTYVPIAQNSLLWISTGDSALAIGKKLLQHRYVLGLLELYDRRKRYLRALKPFITRARRVVVPEPCRAAIFRVWYQLPYTPTVLPNKPYSFAGKRNMPVPPGPALDELNRIQGRKLLLYQARMVRMEAFDVARAINDYLGDEYVLGILGQIRDHSMFTELKNLYPDLVHVDYIPPPDHLSVTSHAHIGFLIYNYESLNNVFCAPNKTWEYASLRLPMMCHELPMLSQQLEQYKAGETFRSGDPRSVAEGIRRIDDDYDAYCNGAEKLFASVNIKEIIFNTLHNHLLEGMSGSNTKASISSISSETSRL